MPFRVEIFAAHKVRYMYVIKHAKPCCPFLLFTIGSRQIVLYVLYCSLYMVQVYKAEKLHGKQEGCNNRTQSSHCLKCTLHHERHVFESQHFPDLEIHVRFMDIYTGFPFVTDTDITLQKYLT